MMKLKTPGTLKLNHGIICSRDCFKGDTTSSIECSQVGMNRNPSSDPKRKANQSVASLEQV